MPLADSCLTSQNRAEFSSADAVRGCRGEVSQINPRTIGCERRKSTYRWASVWSCRATRRK
jgi:hypothetical protein